MSKPYAVALASASLAALVSCHGTDLSGPDSLSYSATASIVNDSTFIGSSRYHLLHTDVVVQNVSHLPITVQYGGCPVASVLTPFDGAAQPPVFDSANDRNCTAELAIRTIAVGGSLTLSDQAYVSASSLSAGLFGVTARTYLNGDLKLISAGTVRLR
jgi:hypothetical protein